jgi:hypothetical protein
MGWFVVKLCFEISSASTQKLEAEEQIRLINAKDEALAYEKALSLAHSYETPVKHISGDEVRWKFLGIRSLYPLVQLSDETEIDATTFQPDDIQRYKHDLKLLHDHLRSKLTHYELN